MADMNPRAGSFLFPAPLGGGHASNPDLFEGASLRAMFQKGFEHRLFLGSRAGLEQRGVSEPLAIRGDPFVANEVLADWFCAAASRPRAPADATARRPFGGGGPGFVSNRATRPSAPCRALSSPWVHGPTHVVMAWMVASRRHGG